MNPTPTPQPGTPAQPPPIPNPQACQTTGAQTSLGATEDEREPLAGWWVSIEAVLRQPRRITWLLTQPDSGRLILALVSVSLLGALIYGVVVGSFSGGTQLWAAPLKVAGGLLASALICLPSLYIFSCLSGSTARFPTVAGLVAGLLALTTLLLLGFAPVAWVFSQSTRSETAMGVLHLAFWTVATWFGWRFLRRGFTHLKAQSGVLGVWIVIFVLVALQMTTALRPLVGTADTFFPEEKQFFLNHWFQCLETKPDGP